MRHVLMCCIAVVLSVGLVQGQTVSYTGNVRPIFDSYGCLGCHGGSGNLFLDTYSTVFTTGDHKPVVVAGDTNSVLILKLKGTAGFGARMPKGGEAMAPADLQTIIAWVKGGAVENTTSAGESGAPLLRTFDLQQNYPNPFNPSTRIRFSVPSAGPVRLAVYDAVGREAAVIVNGVLPAGSYEYPFSGRGLSSGTYYYRLEADGSVSTKKFILTK